MAQLEMAESLSHELPADIDPHEGLLEEIRRTARIVDWLETRLRIYVPGQTEDYMAAVERRFDKERQQLVRVCQAAIHAGVAERQVAIAEKWGAELAVLLRLILRDLELTPEQKQIAPAVIEQHIGRMELAS
jgi:hypothetical protein